MNNSSQGYVSVKDAIDQFNTLYYGKNTSTAELTDNFRKLKEIKEGSDVKDYSWYYRGISKEVYNNLKTMDNQIK